MTIMDSKGKKWSSRDLLEKASMQEALINKLRNRIAQSEAKIEELTKCHLAAEKELLERERQLEKIAESNSLKLSAGGGDKKQKS